MLLYFWVGAPSLPCLLQNALSYNTRIVHLIELICLQNYFNSYNPDNVWEAGPNLDCRKSFHDKNNEIAIAAIVWPGFGTTDHDKCVVLSLTRSMVYVLLKFDSI